MTVFEAIELGLQHQRAGRLAEAESIYRQILAVHPNDENCLHLLGVIASNRGQHSEAVRLISRAIEINPQAAEFHSNLSLALMGQGQFSEAVEACRRGLEIKPDSAEIYNNLGNALRDLGQLGEAIAAYHQSLRHRPNFPAVYSNLSVALRTNGQVAEAIAACRTALQLQPNFPEVYNNLGTAFEADSQTEAALAAYQTAVRLNPNLAETHNNVGNALVALGRVDEAIAAFGIALKLAPGYEQAKFNFSLALLLHGDLERGWSHYEARWEALHLPKRKFSEPVWDGSPLNGRRLLIYAEQGLGDSIQFIRYAQLAAERGGEIIVECPATLFELFQGVRGVTTLVSAGETLPKFDVRLPMLSLPLVFRTTLENIPHEVPYLFADAGRRQKWSSRLSGHRTRKRVGLTWAGNRENRRSRVRDIRLDDLLPLLRKEGFDFYSLQIGDGSAQLQQLPAGVSMIDETSHIRDFADTAALLAELDLIVTVDTAVAHLAGALGRPVWTLLPFAPDWRWGLAGESTPWYPTMRLFRQSAIGDWPSVVRRVSEELAHWKPSP